MKRGDRHTIAVDGQKLNAEFLGQGHYAKAWRVGDDVFLFVSGCYMKEAIEGLNSPHIPPVERLECVESRRLDGDDTYIYKMPFYEALTPAHKDAWAQFRELQRATEAARPSVIAEHGGYGNRFAKLSYIGYAVNDRIIETADVPATLKDALRDMASAAANYGSGVTFEFAKRNLGVDVNGNLILRDVLFDAEKIEQERNQQMKRSREMSYGMAR